MKKSQFAFVAALALAFIPWTASAQQNPVSSSIRTTVSRQAQNLVGAAEEMPPGDYGFKPTPEQMSFGQLMLHVAKSNSFLCSKISGQTGPDFSKLTETSPKDDLVAAVKSSASFCNTALASVDDSGLGQQVTVFGNRQMPKAAAMIALTNDLADHYSQSAIYLRLKGHLPPTARRREM
ncbi:MAG TPA: DinB family protein [Candidatus Acidoferrales bacterium]|nr:DinB family protein [Candidatus Acidoferrales bacterium]